MLSREVILIFAALYCRGGYFDVFSLQQLLFLAKLRPHGCMATRPKLNLRSSSTPTAAAATAERMNI